MQDLLPHINFRREVTIGHLTLDYDTPVACNAKVNPPIRSQDDVEFLPEKLLESKPDWVVMDCACCFEEMKTDNHDRRDGECIWVSKSGFGGTEYLLSGLCNDGSKRDGSSNHMAGLVCKNPAERYGISNKGDIAIGKDVDIVLLDRQDTLVVHAKDGQSAQGYATFEGIELTGRAKSTYLRGQPAYDNGEVIGAPLGCYLRRQTADQSS